MRSDVASSLAWGWAASRASSTRLTLGRSNCAYRLDGDAASDGVIYPDGGRMRGRTNVAAGQVVSFA
jgi:hypothetical protein